jgi:NADH-quinone oxidoreductase subunit E
LTKSFSFARINIEKIKVNNKHMTKTKPNKTDEEREHNIEATRQILRKFSRKRPNLIPVLQKVQGKLEYLPREAMTEIAGYLNIPAIDVYGVVTFYNQFRLTPPGKHSIRVCLGTACHMKGGYITLEAWERRLNIKPRQTTEDREFDLDTVACVGCCTMAPVTVVDDKPEGKVEPTRVDGILLAFEREREAKDKDKGKSDSD